jgi:hypothetical protein
MFKAVLRIRDVYPGSGMFIPDPGSGMFIPDPGSLFLTIPDPGFKNSNKRER